MSGELNLKGFTELNSLEMDSINGGNFLEELGNVICAAAAIALAVDTAGGALAAWGLI